MDYVLNNLSNNLQVGGSKQMVEVFLLIAKPTKRITEIL